MTVKELMSRVAVRDVDGYAEIYKVMWTDIYVIGMTYFHNKEDAEDLVQNIFLKIWQKPEDYKPSLAGGKQWVLTKVKFTALDMLRNKKSRMNGYEEYAREIINQQQAAIENIYYEIEGNPLYDGLTQDEKIVATYLSSGYKRADILKMTGMSAKHYNYIFSRLKNFYKKKISYVIKIT